MRGGKNCSCEKTSETHQGSHAHTPAARRPSIARSASVVLSRLLHCLPDRSRCSLHARDTGSSSSLGPGPRMHLGPLKQSYRSALKHDVVRCYYLLEPSPVSLPRGPHSTYGGNEEMQIVRSFTANSWDRNWPVVKDWKPTWDCQWAPTDGISPGIKRPQQLHVHAAELGSSASRHQANKHCATLCQRRLTYASIEIA